MLCGVAQLGAEQLEQATALGGVAGLQLIAAGVGVVVAQASADQEGIDLALEVDERICLGDTVDFVGDEAAPVVVLSVPPKSRTALQPKTRCLSSRSVSWRFDGFLRWSVMLSMIEE